MASVTAPLSLDEFRSPSDKKRYRVVTLANGLEALLVQNEPPNGNDNVHDGDAEPDPEPVAVAVSTRARRHSFFSPPDEGEDVEHEGDDDGDDDGDDKPSTSLHAAACMTVGVGSMADPSDLRGLAHYLEHMLFMGSDKYPDENEFEAFLSTHGGYSNGATECESTRYVFEIGPRHLRHALDMFAQFFIAPLFKQDAMERELLAIESEFNRALQNDYVRLQQIQCETCVPDHAYDTFSWGNMQSLQTIPSEKQVDVRERMIEFYRTKYSANVMKLCVYGQDSLDDMEQWVVASFGKIPRVANVNSVTLYDAVPRPFGAAAGQKPMLIKILPVRKMHAMHLYWPLPPLLHSYRQKPWEYLSHVLGHEGDGSLTAILKRKRWATYVSAGISESDGYEFGSFGSLFEVAISLTRTGLERWDDVVQIVFDVLHFTKQQQHGGALESWIFDELKASAEMTFLFQEEKEPLMVCRRMSDLMQDRRGVDRRDLLRYDTMQGTFDETQTRALLDEMTPLNTRVLLLSHAFAEDLQLASSLVAERWFGAKYASSEIASGILERWRAPSECLKELKHPSPNRFLPQRFDVIPRAESSSSSGVECGDNCGGVPALVHSTPMSKLWFKQDDTFFIPKTNANFLICLPSITKCVRNYVYAKIYMRFVNDALKHVLYQANNANLEFDVGIRDLDVEVTFSGFSDKLRDLVREVFDVLLSATMSPLVFSIIKDELVREYRNLNLKPSTKARYLRLQLLERITFPVEDKIRVLSEVQLDDVVAFKESVLWNCDVTLRSLVHGNITRADAIALQTEIEAALQDVALRFAPPLSPLRPHTTALPVTANGLLLRAVSDHDEETNSAVEVYYQVGKCSYEDHAYAELLHQIMQEPLFHALRTRQQLGYEVSCCVRDTHGVLGFSIAVQSASHAAGEIAVCIDRFVQHDFCAHLDALRGDEFAHHVATLQRLKSRLDTTLTDETDRHWEEIQTRRYDFHVERELVDALSQCCLEGLRERYRAWLLASSADDEDAAAGPSEGGGARKLRVHVVGKSSQFVPLETLVTEDEAPEIIDNLREYKKALRCHC
uniref:Nardilysin n=1 Tax=Globisporangium ultimum (strain ATCC 200006 / CBS 805.95 / DAOM BR144) TaxID=431595 RepID=K3WX23_GLOUD